jgi:hypothetical protein
MADAPQRPLPDVFHDWLNHTIDEDGVEIPHGLVLDHANQRTVIALAVPPEQAYQVMFAHVLKAKAREAIFALDRFAKPNQGTTLADLVAGHHFSAGTWRPFVVEYQHAPRIVKPIDWTNPFWNAALTSELAGSLRDAADRVGQR